MEPGHIEFLAENELVSIVPNFSHGPMHFLCGTFGPFEPAVQMQVPLWLALALRARHRCRICPPDWLTVEALTELKEREESEQLFTPVPSPHYRELAAMLLQHAAEDLPQSERLRCLVKDVWDLRMAKLRSSFHLFLGSEAASARLTHLTRMEICTVRAFVTKSLDQVYRLRTAAEALPAARAAAAAAAASGSARGSRPGRGGGGSNTSRPSVGNTSVGSGSSTSSAAASASGSERPL